MKFFTKQRFNRPMITKLNTFGSSLLLSIFTAQSAMAQVNIAQVPLFLKESVDSNLVFIFDDSGSMGWRYMPDNLGGNDIFENHFYSSQVNKVYYDPTVDYIPPFRPGGSGRYPNSSYTDAWVNGFNQSGETDNLSEYIRFDQIGSIEEGFYMQFNSSSSCDVNPKQNACYTAVLLNDASDAVKQNYANWFSYYSRRDLAAKTGITEAFFDLPENIRVGYGAINVNNNAIDGVDDTDTLVSGVRTFDSVRREQFLTWLHNKSVGGGTPLRTALRDVGDYFSRADNRGPWGEEPGINNNTPHTECRQSFGLIMTDGIWNGGSPGVGNTDNTAGPSYTNPDPDGSDFTYSNVSPFADDYSNTLADVAMAFWKNDLRTDIDNKVPVTSTDPAFWQHMTTFTIGLGVQGQINEADAIKAVKTGDEVTWPEPAGNRSPENIDDLLHAAINGRGGYASAQNPEAFTAEIQNFLADVIARSQTSASSAAVSSAVLRTETLGYFAGFRSDDWSGTLSGFNLNLGTEIWNAEETLANTLPAERKLISYNGSSGVELLFDSPASLSNLSTAQQNALNADPTQANIQDDLGYKRLAWLHGDNPADPSFRDRQAQTPGGVTVTRLLGDIINANPQFVGNTNYGFRRLSGAEGLNYGAFRSTTDYQNRTKALYVAANDGILHAFNSETGEELFGYIPSELLLPSGANQYARISELMNPNYTHQYFMDGTPRAHDAYIDKDGDGSKEWRTLLLGAMGSGGKTVFALDITDPDSFSPSDDVLWEFQHPNLGSGVKDPQIARLEDGRWVAIFGNGYNGDTDQSSLFIVDLSDGSLVRELQTGSGSAAIPNGLAPAAIVGFPENDGITRLAYAGDLLGNMWQFDITGNESSWSTTKIFNAESPFGETQPITVAPRAETNPNNDEELVVLFGTGSFLRTGDESNNNIQTFYAIRDDLSASNLTRSDLLQQTITRQETVSVPAESGNGVRTFTLRDTSSNKLTAEKGWYLDLVYNGVQTGERVISRAAFPFGVNSDRVRFTTVIPDQDPCGSARTGFLMDLQLTTGEKSDRPVFDLDGDGQFNTNDIVNGYAASGIQWGDGSEIRSIGNPDPREESEVLIGEPGAVSCETGLCTRSLNSGIGRQTWEQLR